MAKRLLSGASFLSAVLLCCAAPAAAASSLSIDRSFGVGGYGGGELGLHYAEAGFEDVVEQADGSLLASRERLIRRYLPNGALDSGFAPKQVEPPAPEATQADGKRLVRGGNNSTVLRFNADGTPDLGFHGGVSEPTASYSLQLIEPLPSGQILVAGYADRLYGKSGVEPRIGLSLLNPDGTLDRSFGEGGSAFVPEASASSLLALVPQPDGAVLLVRSTATLRLTAGGSLDRSFAAATYPPDAYAISAKALPGGGFALAGTSGGAAARDLFVAHYGPGGAPDRAFAGGSGIAIADLGGDDQAGSVLWEDGGAAVIGGTSTVRNTDCEQVEACVQVPVVVRFGAEGSLDPRFGGGGAVRLEPLSGTVGRGEIGGVAAVALRRAGGYFLAGSAAPLGTVAYLAAIAADGQLDPGFGSEGIVRETKPSRSSEGGGPVAVGRDGEILVGGTTTAGPGYSAGVFRYTRNGELDSGYGERGFARLPAIKGVLDLAVDSSGAAVVLAPGGELTRVTPEGATDPGFGSGRPIALDRPKDTFGSVALSADGKILLAGTSDWDGRRSQMLVARLLPSGSPDPSFGRKGFATVGCARRGRCAAKQLTLQPDGRILLAGRVQKTGATSQWFSKPSRLAVARLLPDGRPDSGFGGDGMVTLPAGYHAAATAIAWSRGGVLVAGRVGPRRSDPQALLLRYRSDGRLDGRFGSEGIVRRSGAGEPVALLSTPGRVFVAYEAGPVAVQAFGRHGQLQSSLSVPRLTRSSKQKIQLAAALQGRRPVVVWPMTKGTSRSSPTQIELARLGGG